jgi:RimJ/RimL family protein N-acetyltransferase
MTDPRDFCRSDTLKNGVAVTIRHLRADDRQRVVKAVGQLDPDSIYTRLFSHRKELTSAGLERIMHTDARNEVALVVTTERGGEEILIGSGRYIVTGTATGARNAEIAFLVEEDYQGQGIAGKLLRDLASIAREQGIATFEADVLGRNKSMLVVFEKAGLPMRKRREGDTLHLTLALSDTAAQSR